MSDACPTALLTMSRNGPPDFLFDRLHAQAVIDFVTVHSSHPLGLTFARGQRALWSPAEQQLTILGRFLATPAVLSDL
ncbi:MAG: hypothetical protein CFE45_07960 [Burkholderiales bacterium PBB5]|nr:MAG: hypothetical protein CFE45_07960 [Burkholderiales bacterium PBB5]